MKFLILTSLLIAPVSAKPSLQCAGVLGNSGEQGAALVRFADKPASGIGVVQDATGSLWDRAGDGQLNRYAVDGRLLASYPLPAGGGGANDRDTLTNAGGVLLIKIGAQLLALPPDTPAGGAPELLPVAANRLSLGVHEGWAAAADGKKVFLVNVRGETKPVATLDETPTDLEIGPEDGIYAARDGKLERIDAFAPADRRGPWTPPGDRAQWLAGHWFGSAWHGTLRRLSPQLTPDPGVVLGGASGSFIGYVPGNHELNDARGLAWLGGELFAASGSGGVLHLMEWNASDRRFMLLRRIGAVPACRALAFDGGDRVWFHSGFWEWSDGPDTPLRHSVPPPDAPGCAGAATLPGGAIVAPGIRWGKKALYYGTVDGPAALSEDIPLPAGAVTCTAAVVANRRTLLIADSTGQGRVLFLGTDGRYEADGGPLQLTTASALEGVTSLATLGEGSAAVLYAAAQGGVIELKPEGGGWRETRRWDSWGDGPEARFGGVCYLAASEGRLWVADGERHRVLCFDPASRRCLATFGEADRAGQDLAHLDRPGILAVRGSRAVVHDAGNQRLIKLTLEPGAG